MGHNFGMSHTNTISTGKGVPASCYDQSNPHIMDPSSSSTPPTTWTTCSKAFLKYYIDEGSYGRFSNVPACMENSPTTAWSGAAAVCGDGVRVLDSAENAAVVLESVLEGVEGAEVVLVSVMQSSRCA